MSVAEVAQAVLFDMLNIHFADQENHRAQAYCAVKRISGLHRI